MTDGLTGSNETVPGILRRPADLAVELLHRARRLRGRARDRGQRRLKIAKPGPPLVFDGALTVSGPAAATGVLGVKGSSLRGTLGGKLVG